MEPRFRITLLLVALVAAIGVAAWRGGLFDNSKPVGMTESPCADNRLPVTGKRHHDWAGLCVYRAANARLMETGVRPRLVMIGDSLTDRWQAFDPSLFGSDRINRGIGGQTSQKLALRFQQDAVALHPQIVHILVGTNDIAGNTGPSDPEMYRANIQAMVEMAEANGIAVILGTIPPARDFYWRPDVSPGPWVPILNRWLAEFAEERDLVLADYHPVLAAPGGGINEALYEDGAHPNRAGYAAMRQVLEKALAEASSRSAPDR